MNYLAYSTRPELAQIPGSDFWKVTGWKILGPCTDMADAIKRYGGHPVLQRTKGEK
jgi:hypothetical protein